MTIRRAQTHSLQGHFSFFATEPQTGGRARPGGAQEASATRGARPGRRALAGRGRAPPAFSPARTGTPGGLGGIPRAVPGPGGEGRGAGLWPGWTERPGAPRARPRGAGVRVAAWAGPGGRDAALPAAGPAPRGAPSNSGARPGARTPRQCGARRGAERAARRPGARAAFLPAGSASRRRRRRAHGLAARPSRRPAPRPAGRRPRPGPAPLRRSHSGPAAGWRAVPAGCARTPRGSLGRPGGCGALGAAGGRAGPELRGAARAAPAPAARARGPPTRALRRLRRLLRRRRPAPRRFPLSAGCAGCGRGEGGDIRAAGRSPRGG